MIHGVSVIGFDADDTLWVNEPLYRKTEDTFCSLLSDYLPGQEISTELFTTEMNNIELYGFGIKSFVLSMVETALRVSSGKVPHHIIEEIIKLGKAQLNEPVELLDGVEGVLKELQPRYRLILATKGDLLDQERKLKKSCLSDYFHHIEIMSDKKEENYRTLFEHLDIEPHEFAMVGNSLKSDIEPVLNLGGWAIYIPYHITWIHEKGGNENMVHEKYHREEKIHRIPRLFP